MTPDEYCQDKAARSGSSFYYAFLFLPPERRRAITALYAFCREVDDVVDETSEPSVARMKLVWWREQLDALFQGEPPIHPVLKALAPHIENYDLRYEELLAVIDGMEMDLDQSRYERWTDLEKYCWHVASVVGILSAKIFGQTQKQTTDYAVQLGLAFQMTNIIRDVGDDARRGRIYLPLEDLDRFEVRPQEILNAQYSERFVALMRHQSERAHEFYRLAAQTLPAVDRRAQRPGLLMAAIYHTLLQEIDRDHWDVLDKRISLTPIRKFWLAWKNWVTNGGSFLKSVRS
ncbi:MAG TPA: presqualene diphosphate synthase HpnD [Paenalcaligenes sp.]|nr:presqualene diphosphate synthase HpnD [Paenalcaligenes sp.]